MTAPPSYAELQARRAQACALNYVVAADAQDAAQAGVLAEVGTRSERSGYEQFSLLFRTQGAPRQGNYAVTFADGMRCDVFLVPVAREGEQIVYEACFNRQIVA